VDREKLIDSLRALARQEAGARDPITLSLDTLVLMLELRDDRIRELSEFQSDVLRARRHRRAQPLQIAVDNR
jgi:hypothetical protein